MTESSKPKCPKCNSENLLVERRLDGNANCVDCKWFGPYSDCFKEAFVDAEKKFKEWFYDRGYKEHQLMMADAAYKKFLQVEDSRGDKRPWDRAPGFKRVFMMGYFYGAYND